MQLALEYSIVLERWKTVHQLLLEKNKDGAKVHKLRNVTLVEIDFMFIMKQIWAHDLVDKNTQRRYIEEILICTEEQVV